jgi:hypothetical protein
MMVVYEGDCSRNLAVCHLLPMLNEMIANHVTDRQRPISVSLLFDHSIKFFEQPDLTQSAEASPAQECRLRVE